ncbi:hypothetical protein [Bifidobacterium sp. ESL0732]|uniref:hypothetical protein n=1 Tax=Bifidobacterium sp. ESL0732 TaxID=2983222 RepID=UPI0023F6CED5|nr:hypothetical protein [Bifidobacterium sp. ESL0732]WEV63419.1 hypothetical protein OZX70_05465 [Bifidobacterium sp. ESL0732]
MKDISWKENAIVFVITLVTYFVLGIFWFDHGHFLAALTDPKLWSQAIGLSAVLVVVHVVEDMHKAKKKREAEHSSSASEK